MIYKPYRIAAAVSKGTFFRHPMLLSSGGGGMSWDTKGPLWNDFKKSFHQWAVSFIGNETMVDWEKCAMENCFQANHQKYANIANLL